jgi:hypothetical protein
MQFGIGGSGPEHPFISAKSPGIPQVSPGSADERPAAGRLGWLANLQNPLLDPFLTMLP